MNWQQLIRQESEKPYFGQLQQRLQQARASHKVFPPAADEFAAFELTPYDAVEVVILGQDPYHQEGQAQGLSFSVPAGIPPPPSLRNIYKAVAHDISDFHIPTHGNLQAWAEQGVLLLNTVLTVSEGKPHSHARWGWQQFTDTVLHALNEHPKPLVFMLWGAHAQAKGAGIDEERHCVLRSVHPSPLSAYRGFLTCGHFAAANRFLTKHQRAPIDWSVL